MLGVGVTSLLANIFAHLVVLFFVGYS